MMKQLSVLLWVAGFLSMVGCSSFSSFYQAQAMVKNHDNDYLKAHAAPPLQMPIGLHAQMGCDYPIEGLGANVVPTTPVSEIPPGSLSAEKTAQYKK